MYRRHLLNIMYHPDAPGGAGTGTTTTAPAGQSEDAQDLADLGLGDVDGPEDVDDPDDDVVVPDADGDKDEEGADEAGEGAPEGEEETEEAGEKKPEDAEGDLESRPHPTAKQLKAAFPEIFKKFPTLRAAFFDYPKFLEVFPDSTAAANAAAKASEFDQMEEAIVGNGDPSGFLTTLAENNPRALKRMAQNFPEALRAADEVAYVELTTPIITELLNFAAHHGEKTGNKNLLMSARHLANYVFQNGGTIPEMKAKPTEESPEAIALKQERNERQQERFTNAAKTLNQRVAPAIERVYEAKLDDLSPFEKKYVVSEVRMRVDKQLSEDRGFQSRMKGLWTEARGQNYSDASLQKIGRVWLEHAKSIAPGIRHQLRKEALQARTRGGSDKTETREPGKKRTFPNTGAAPRTGGSRVLDPSKIDWSRTSDADILSDDSTRVRLRK